MTAELDTIYEEARTLWRKKRYSEALQVLKRTENEKARFLYARMRCLSRMGRLDEALQYFNLLNRMYDDERISVLAREIRDHASLSKEEVLEELAILCDYEEASWLFGKKRYLEALATLEEVDRRDQPEFVYAEARCLGKLGRFDEALAACTRLEKKLHDKRGAALAEKLHAMLAAAGVTESSAAELPLLPTEDDALPAWDTPTTWDKFNLQKSSSTGVGQDDTALGAAGARLEWNQDTLKVNVGPARTMKEDADHTQDGPSWLQDSREGFCFPEKIGADLTLTEIADSEKTVTAPQQEVGKLTASMADSLAQDKPSGLAFEPLAPPREIVESQNTDFDVIEQPIAGSEMLDAAPEYPRLILDAGCEQQRAEENTYGLELAQSRAECDRLEGTVQIQKSELEASARRIAELETATVESQSTLDELAADLEPSLRREESEKLKLDEVHAERDQFRGVVESQKAELQSSAQRVAELETVTTDLERRLGELTTRYQQSQSEITTEKLKLDEARAERDQLRVTVETQETELQGSARRIAELEAVIVDLERKLGELTADLQQSRNERASETLALDEVRAERDQLRGVVESQKAELQGSAQRNAELEAVTVDLERRLGELTADLQQSRNERTSETLALGEVRAERDDLRGAAESQKAEFQGFAERIAEFERVGAEFEQQVGTLETTLKQVRADLAASVQTADDLRAERDELRTIMGSQDDDLEGAAQQITEIKTVKADVERQLRTLAEELEDSRARERATAQTLEEARSQQERLNAAIEQLKNDKMQVMQHMADRETLVASLQQMVEILTADIGQLRSQELAASQALETVRTERDHLKTLLGQHEIVASNPIQPVAGRDVVANALQRQIVALAEDVAPLFAAVRSSLGILAREVAKIERDRMGNIIETSPNESRQAKRRRSLLSAIPPRSFLDDSIEPANLFDESPSPSQGEETSD